MATQQSIDNVPRPPSSVPVRTVYSIPKFWVFAFALVVITFVAYIPAMRCGFIWDDDLYVTGNQALRSADGLQKIWSTPGATVTYYPLVFTTFWTEYHLWKLQPFGYHLVNILVHALNAILLWQVLRRLGLSGAWLAAAIWAVHPVNVESVAWITELKNTQSTLFSLLTLLAWMKFTEKETVRPWRFYALALLLYGPALFSKTTACTLPAAMLLILWLRKEPIGWRRWVQIVPFLCYGVGMSLTSIWSEAHLGNYAEAVRYSYSGVGRLLIATHALWFYAAKLAWPTQLTFSYPRWEINLHDPLQYIWLIACIAVALLLWWRRNTLGRGTVTAIVFFVAALSPLLGFIPVFTFRYSFVADHYQYVANMGLIALFAGVVSSYADTWHLGHNMRCILSALLLLVLGALTWQQSSIYQNWETIWRDTLTKNPLSWMAHNNLGNVFLKEGKINDAIGHYEQALQINPDCDDAYNNLGNAFLKEGKISDAIGYYEQALRIRPDLFQAHYNLGNAFKQAGKIEEAIAHYEQALRISPDYAEAHNNLGDVLKQAGKTEEAIAHYEQALRIKPDYIEPNFNLGNAFLKEGKFSEAIEHYEQVLRIRPDLPQAHYGLAIALEQSGRKQEAIEHYEQVLRLKPDFAAAQNALVRLQQ